MRKMCFLFLLLSGLLDCSEADKPAEEINEPCLNATMAPSGLNYSCVAGYHFNKRDLGLVSMTFQWIRDSRGCDEMSATVGMEKMGNVRVAIAEETGKVELSSSQGGLALIPASDRPDAIYLRSQDSAHPGEVATTLISCPGLSDTVRALMEARGESSPSCNSADPNGSRRSVEFTCDELDKYTRTLPFYQASFNSMNIHEVGAAHLAARNLRKVADRIEGPKRGQIMAVVTILMTIAQLAMQSQQFSTKFASVDTPNPASRGRLKTGQSEEARTGWV